MYMGRMKRNLKKRKRKKKTLKFIIAKLQKYGLWAKLDRWARSANVSYGVSKENG